MQKLSEKGIDYYDSEYINGKNTVIRINAGNGTKPENRKT